MSDDRIAEILARHEQVPSGNLSIEAISLAHDDRATLLAEVDRLRADLATQQGCCDGAAAQDAHIRREREEHRAEVERLRAENERLSQAIGLVTTTVPDMQVDIENPVGMMQRVVAEIERLRAALVLGSEVLASHQGSPQREWHSGGAWLYPGESINVVRAPLPEIKVEP